MSYSEREKQSRLWIALGVAVLLANFRLWVFASLGIHFWARTALLIPFVIVIWSAVRNRTRERLSKLDWALIFGLVLSGIYSAVALHSQNMVFGRDVAPFLSATAYFMVFPILLRLSSFTLNDYLKALDVISWVIAILGSCMMIGIGLIHDTPTFQSQFIENLQNWALPGVLAQKFGSTYLAGPPARMLGHTFSFASSGVAVAATANYVLFRVWSIGNKKLYPWAGLLWCLALGGVIASTSLESSIAMVLGLGVVVVSSRSNRGHSFKIREVISALGLAVALLVVVGLFTYFVPTLRDRALHYVDTWSKIESRVWPKVSGCTIKKVLWVDRSPFEPTDFTCTKEEFNLFLQLDNYGLVPTLGWFIWFFAPLFMFGHVFRRHPEKIPIMALLITFILGCPHANVLQHWGNNFIFALGWAALFWRERLRA